MRAPLRLKPRARNRARANTRALLCPHLVQNARKRAGEPVWHLQGSIVELSVYVFWLHGEKDSILEAEPPDQLVIASCQGTTMSVLILNR